MRKTLSLLMMIACLAGGASAYAVKIADVTRLGGQRTNWMTGMGLVVGLNGTGDGGSYAPATKMLATMLEKFHDPVSNLKDLGNSQNVAIVMITATIPKDGVHTGDKLNITVSCIGDAKSLKGGRLYVTPLTGPMAGKSIHALAQGPITLLDGTPTTGVISQGAQMERDLFMTYVVDGKLTLILDDPAADWTNAWSIAKVINDAMNERGEELAVAKNPKTVEVTIPAAERERPDGFISAIQRLPMPMLPTEARVVINERAHSMVLSGDVEISPAVIVYGGLTISTSSPPPEGTKANPLVTNKQVVGISTTGVGGAKMQDLITAMDQLKVSADDRIVIIKELYKEGKLHAKLILE